jgi:hypothetical protein
MDSPVSGFIAEIFLQYYEDYTIKYYLEDKKIIFYKTYVDDILIIFESCRNHSGTNRHVYEKHTQTPDLQTN